MKIQLVHDTELGKTQMTLLDCNWGVNDVGGPDDDVAKLIVFGDDKLDVIVPMAQETSSSMGSKMILAPKPAGGIVRADLSDIARVRNGKEPHGS